MRPNLPFLSAASNAILKPGGPLRWKVVGERRKTFAAAHRSDENRQAFISASRCASAVIAKAKAEVWQTTCSSLSPKSNHKSAYSLLRSIAGSPSSSPNFTNCSSYRESASVYAAYLRAHFFRFSAKDCVAEPEATYLSELCRATCSVESHSSFALLSLPLNFLRLSPTFPLAQTKLPIPC